MADKRINALTTTSASVGDDYFAIDGATNGTRALSAFSPTFGGNATVTGTLTANSTITAANTIKYVNSGVANGTTVAPLAADIGADATLGALQVTIGGSPSATGASRFGYIGAGDVGAWRTFIVGSNNSSGGGQVLVPSTLSSTTTSSGALVVGNGTSGGLGVGGAINAGSYLRSINSAAANDTEFTALRADVGADGTLAAAVVAIGALPSATGASRYGFITCSDNVDWRKLYIGGRPGLASSGGQVLIPSTASSTSTSSGALVVSGGVGVAGKVTSTALNLANTSQSISAWGDIGPQLSIAGAVVTDTTSSGTVSRAVANSINATAFAASSSTTYTQAVSLFIADAPTANTNVTISHRYAIYTAGGRINFQGLPTSSAGLQAGTLWNDSGTLKVA